MTKSSDIPPLATTGIGSLPYREGASALNQAFAVDIPYFPTLPRRDFHDGLLSQALTGFPGVFWQMDGRLRFELSAWERGREGLAEKLVRDFHRNQYRDYPPGASGGLWDLFVERLSRDAATWGKAQWLGPITALRALGEVKAPPALGMELVAQLSEWLFARAFAMTAELRRAGKEVIFFWDEPGLAGGESADPLASLAREHLRERIVELKNYGAVVGVHCCGQWEFAELLRWPFEIASFDLALSGEALLSQSELVRTFRARGGRLALGIVPTEPSSAWQAREEVEQWRARFVAAFGEADGRVLLAESLLTPACGLATRSPEETARIFALLAETKKYLAG